MSELEVLAMTDLQLVAQGRVVVEMAELTREYNYWKTRAEALEQALRKIDPPCPWCAFRKKKREDCEHYNPPMPYGTPRSNDPPFHCEHFQFDQARFTPSEEAQP